MWSGIASAGLSAGISGLSNLVNYNISSQNQAASQKSLSYQKYLNQVLMDREDNAVQRRVADLKAAGLSPVLAAGQAASTNAGSAGSAPQNDFKFDGSGLNVIDNAVSVAGQLLALEQGEANIAKTRAERDYVALQSQRAEIGAMLDNAQLRLYPAKERLLNAQIGGTNARTALAEEDRLLRQIQRDIAGYNLDQSRTLGLRTNETTNPWTLSGGLARQLGGYDIFGRILDGIRPPRSIGKDKSVYRGRLNLNP